jgi:hypothetical protein
VCEHTYFVIILLAIWIGDLENLIGLNPINPIYQCPAETIYNGAIYHHFDSNMWNNERKETNVKFQCPGIGGGAAGASFLKQQKKKKKKKTIWIGLDLPFGGHILFLRIKSLNPHCVELTAIKIDVYLAVTRSD